MSPRRDPARPLQCPRLLLADTCLAMWSDLNWFFTDEPNVMWGRQLEYVESRFGKREEFIVAPDQRRFTSLRRAFALYRLGVNGRGPTEDQLEVMRRTLSWLHCGRYEQPVIKQGAKCPANSRGMKIDDRRIICDVFGGSRPLFEHYLLYLEMVGLTTIVDVDVYGLTREGQAALIMLELTRPRSGVATSAGWLRDLQSEGRWITVDPNRWASGEIIAGVEELFQLPR